MITGVRFTDQEGTSLAATIDGREWSNIRCTIVNGIVSVPDGGEIQSQVVPWLAAGNVPASYTPAPPTEVDYATAVQKAIDQTAQARGYSDGVSLASYKDSTNPAWATEATTFTAWRDQVWSYVYGQMGAVQSGQRTPMPSTIQIISELPTIAWPGNQAGTNGTTTGGGFYL
jgi:hypothetical protein